MLGFALAAVKSPTEMVTQLPPVSTQPDFWPKDVVVSSQPVSFCACDGVDEEVEVEFTLPTGIQFTGNCTSSGCEFIPVGSTDEEFVIIVPANHCVDGVTVHMKTDAPIVICTEDSHCPTGFFPGTHYEIRLHTIPCAEPEEPETEANCGGCTR